MSDVRSSNISSRQRLTTAAVMAQFGIIGAVLLCVAGAFALAFGALAEALPAAA
jgi:hypothetical protein